ncbi:MAG: Na+:solute symporter [Acidobacteriota bacterium]|nr:Na+:solute symporter [Acidobacteriota bacterium]MDH3523366.1 Na+:solute symporter [Acidobacteriota bacterium]
MILQGIDWAVIGGYFALALGVGVWAARRAGRDAGEFFLSGRSMPWWLLGVSMVATTFSTDTPNLVADITRRDGVAGNWVWWAFLLTGMLTVFVYAALWRRCGVLTDLEFYELRYSGRPAAFLRGFRAIYLGVFFNVVVMAAVTLAAIKIGSVLFGLSPLATVAVAGTVTVVFSAAGGFRSVVLTDLLLFGVAMTGSVVAAWVAVHRPEVGGLRALMSHPAVADRLALVPDLGDPAAYVPLFLVPLAVQWWAAWYPGSEPGGGGYVAQRMLAARDERHAVGATMLFNAAHYALRPWPWILVALASLVVYPDLEALRTAFPGVEASVLGHDLAYPAMLTFVPAGWLGLVVGSLAAAYMSTISSHLNWGASYVTHDFYRRFVRPAAGERELVRTGRVTTVLLMAAAAFVALRLESALQAFQILLQIGAGTGLLFILRWFWWRISAWSEIAAMAVSFAVAVVFSAVESGLRPWQELLCGVALTTLGWLAATWLTRPTDRATLVAFEALVRPGGPGWRRLEAVATARGDAEPWPVKTGLACMGLGSAAIYGALFATGSWLYGDLPATVAWTAVAVISVIALVPPWRRLDALSDAGPRGGARRRIDGGERDDA